MKQLLESNNIISDLEMPNICPRCHKGIFPKLHPFHAKKTYPRGMKIAIIFQCPICEEFFFADYFIFENPQTGKLIKSPPNIYPKDTKIKLDISEEISKYYSRFFKIYKQSAIAENYQLDEIAGMGYRKALEFLVKDYLIKLYPEKENEIFSESLGSSIKRISDTQLQTLAKASSYIGNDETHVKKNNPEYNIQDMKKFIKYFCYMILAKITVDIDASKLVNKPKS